MIGVDIWAGLDHLSPQELPLIQIVTDESRKCHYQKQRRNDAVKVIHAKQLFQSVRGELLYCIERSIKEKQAQTATQIFASHR
jgi:hypothetical protein